MARPLKLGLVGTGFAADLLYLPAWQRLGDRIELVACTNRTRAKAVKFAKEAGIPTVVDTAEELFALPQVDAVMISTPIDVLPRYVLAALDAGKAVLSEKPIAATPAVARKLIKAAAKYDRPWMVGENVAFMSHAHKLKQWIETGRLGEIRFVEVRQLEWMGTKIPFFNTGWRATPSYPGGFITDGGVHIANLVRRCMGDPVTLKSIVGSFNPALPPLDTAVAAMEFASGALGTWTSCFTAHGDWPWLRVFGSKANAEWRWNDVTLSTPAGKVTRFENREEGFTAQFRHFADVVTKGVPQRLLPEENLGDLRLIERILQSR
jgi:predicted dehydrogenase